jgi:hypothetical protein
MLQRDSASIKSSHPEGPDALVALVRLLARQAAQDLAQHTPREHPARDSQDRK